MMATSSKDMKEALMKNAKVVGAKFKNDIKKERTEGLNYVNLRNKAMILLPAIDDCASKLEWFLCKQVRGMKARVSSDVMKDAEKEINELSADYSEKVEKLLKEKEMMLNKSK